MKRNTILVTRNGKTSAIFTILILGLTLALLSHAGTVQAAPTGQESNPGNPVLIQGTVLIDDAPAPAGTAVTAVFTSGRETATTNADGTFQIPIQANRLQVTENITFIVGAVPAPQFQIVPANGGVLATTLSIISAVPSDNPAPTAAPVGTQIPPTDVPPPTAVALPTPVPTPVQAPPVSMLDAYGPAGIGQAPSVRIRPVEDTIYRNANGIIEVSMGNPALNTRNLVVDMSVRAPANLVVSSADFASSSTAGEASALFQVAPGQSRTVIINLSSKIAGTYLVHALVTYWPQGYREFNQHQSFQHSFRVDFSSEAPADNPALNENVEREPNTPAPGGCNLALGPEHLALKAGGGDAALPALGLLSMVGFLGYRKTSRRKPPGPPTP